MQRPIVRTDHVGAQDAYRGGRPSPAHSLKAVLRLAEHIDDSGELTRGGADALEEFRSFMKDVTGEEPGRKGREGRGG